MTSKTSAIAKLILELTHSELTALASDLVGMQTGARDDGWEWKPDEVHGEHGMVEMLHSWAEGQDD